MTQPDLERELKLQPYRLRMTLMVLGNFGVLAVALALYAMLGELPWHAAWLIGAAGTGQALLFLLAFARRWNLRFADKDLLVPQFCASLGVLLGGLALVPQLWVLFVIGILVAFIFGMMRFGPRQFSVAWLLVGAATAAVMFAVRGRLGPLRTDGLSLAILVAYFFMALHQITVFGAAVTALRTKLSERNRLLADSIERIQQMASHDDLTGVSSRRAFMERLAEERARAVRSGGLFAVLLMDIDHFKSVNDRFGHPAGDAALKAFCRVVVGSGIRSTDRLGRVGGEEFILLLIAPAGADAARTVAERVRKGVEAHDWGSVVPGLSLTTSIGVAVFERGDTDESLIARADRALYAAKEAGRNRTVVG